MKEAIYTSESKLRHPLSLFKEMLSDLLQSRELAWRLMIKDINAQYRQSFLGILWAFLPSLFTSLAFTLANKSNTIQFSKTNIPYAAYVVISMVLFQTFIEALNGPVNAVTNSKVMLAKINFPREALIIGKMGEVLFNFSIKCVLVIAVILYFKISVSWTIIFVPFAILVLVLLGILIGVLLSPLSLLFKDVSNTLGISATFLLFVTPVFYPLPKDGAFSKLVSLNPLAHIIEAIRNLIVFDQYYSFTPFIIISAVSLLGLFIAWLLFKLSLPFAIERVTS